MSFSKKKKLHTKNTLLLYSICYYYGKNKTSNIKNHLASFDKIRNRDDLFILNVMIDSHNQSIHNEIKQILTSVIKSHLNCPFIILTSFNWGGTIVGLWMAYQYGKQNYKDAYIAHFEEDFLPHNVNWFKDIKDLFDLNKNYIYVGESNYQHPIYKNQGIIKHAMNCRNQNKDINKLIQDKLGNMTSHGCGENIKNCRTCGGLISGHQVWTDGGLYFSSIDRLSLVEKVIGIFHKGDHNVKWDHVFDGVELGEVGFPTLLFHNGLIFSALYRSLYFKHG